MRRLTAAAGIVFLHCEQRRAEDVIGAGGAIVKAAGACNTHAIAQAIPGGLCVTTKITAEELARLVALLEHLQHDADRAGDVLHTGDVARHIYELLAVVGPIRDAIGAEHAPTLPCTSCTRPRKRFELFDGECRWCRDDSPPPDDLAPQAVRPAAPRATA